MESVIIPKNVRSLIKKEIPVSARINIVRYIKKAYELVYKLYDEVPMLSTEIAKYHTGYLKHIGIQYVFQKEIENNNFPFEYSVNYNRTGYPYLLIYNEKCEITISQTSSPEKIARHAYFREKLQQFNQLILNLFDESSQKDVIDQPTYYLITHGYQTKTPNFINLGIPDHNGWVDRMNLLEHPILVEESVKSEEKITDDDLVAFKGYLQGVDNIEK